MRAAVSDTYTYNAGDRMTAAGGVSYTYDDNGNLTDRGNDEFGWDAANRLVSTSIDSVSASYEYNGHGLRTSRTVGQDEVTYVWDVNRGLPAILEDGDGNRYVYGLDLIARIDSSDDEEYYLYDGLGSTRALADDGGDVTDTYSYDAFGNVRAQTGSSGNEFTYAGEQTDSTDLQYLRARYYDPAVGRFLSRDPVPFLQRYAYVGNNPANLVDPSGLSPLHPNYKNYLNHAMTPTPESLAVASAMAAVAECIQQFIMSSEPGVCAGPLAVLDAAIEALMEGAPDVWDWMVDRTEDALNLYKEGVDHVRDLIENYCGTRDCQTIVTSLAVVFSSGACLAGQAVFCYAAVALYAGSVQHEWYESRTGSGSDEDVWNAVLLAAPAMACGSQRCAAVADALMNFLQALEEMAYPNDE